MEGILIAIVTFALIGLFHPLVIKGEYYFGRRISGVFLGLGLVFLVLSYLVDSLIASIVLGVTGCCCLWSIREIKDQEMRVLKGWFPENPDRKTYYDRLRSMQEHQE